MIPTHTVDPKKYTLESRILVRSSECRAEDITKGTLPKGYTRQLSNAIGSDALTIVYTDGGDSRIFENYKRVDE